MRQMGQRDNTFDARKMEGQHSMGWWHNTADGTTRWQNDMFNGTMAQKANCDGSKISFWSNLIFLWTACSEAIFFNVWLIVVFFHNADCIQQWWPPLLAACRYLGHTASKWTTETATAAAMAGGSSDGWQQRRFCWTRMHCLMSDAASWWWCLVLYSSGQRRRIIALLGRGDKGSNIWVGRVSSATSAIFCNVGTDWDLVWCHGHIGNLVQCRRPIGDLVQCHGQIGNVAI